MRERIKRNFLATLAFSQGVPMLSHGDELGRTQRGNNNAYCQDNPLTWVDWRLDAAAAGAARVHPGGLRHPAPTIRCCAGAPSSATAVRPGGAKDLTWLRPDGGEMTDAEWDDAANHVLGMLIRGEATDEMDERGRRLLGDAILLL